MYASKSLAERVKGTKPHPEKVIKTPPFPLENMNITHPWIVHPATEKIRKDA